MRFRTYLRYIILFCLTALLIYPVSPYLFKMFIILKEPSYACPIYSREQWRIRSDNMGDGSFAARRSGGRRRHKGLDIAGEVGEPIAAAKSGIARIGEVPHGMGKYVKISHPDGSVSIYGHLSSVDIPDRSWVWRGQIIGKLGKTGNADYKNMEAHLHFEIRISDTAVDPYPYLSKSNG